MRYISHEIRTPLNTICLGLKHLEKSVGHSEISASIECIQEMELSSQIALNIVTDLLTCDKIQSEMLILDKKPCEVYDFVDRCLRPMLIQVPILLRIEF